MDALKLDSKSGVIGWSRAEVKKTNIDGFIIIGYEGNEELRR